jgi:uracil-DNA glycosylase
LEWIKTECALCEPKIIVTLGEEVARVISGSTLQAEELLVSKPSKPESLDHCTTYYCPHPDICRRSMHWRNRISEITKAIKEQLRRFDETDE